MNTDNKFKYQMQRVLFYLFVTIFCLTSIFTLLAIFFNVGSLDKGAKDLFSKIVIAEVTLAVLALFYSVFGIKKQIQIETEKKEGTDFKEYISMFLRLVEGKTYLLLLLGLISGAIISYFLFVLGFGPSVPTETIEFSLSLERSIESLKKVHIKTNRELLDLKKNESIKEFNASKKEFLNNQGQIEGKKILDTFQQYSIESNNIIQRWDNALIKTEKEIIRQYNTALRVNRTITDFLLSISHPKDDMEAMVLMNRAVGEQD